LRPNVSETLRGLVEYAPVVFSAVPAVWVAVTWDAELSLAFPVLLCGFPLIARTGLLRIVFRWIAVVLLVLFDGLAMLSVGRLFVPATLAMVLSALWATVADTNGDRP
jgi:hypothetical protein